MDGQQTPSDGNDNLPKLLPSSSASTGIQSSAGSTGEVEIEFPPEEDETNRSLPQKRKSIKPMLI